MGMNLATDISFYFQWSLKEIERMQHPASFFSQAGFSPSSLSVCIVQGNRKQKSSDPPLGLSSLSPAESIRCATDSSSLCPLSFQMVPASDATTVMLEMQTVQLCVCLWWDISNKVFEFCASNAGSTATGKQSIWDWSLAFNCLLLILVFWPR